MSDIKKILAFITLVFDSCSLNIMLSVTSKQIKCYCQFNQITMIRHISNNFMQAR